MPGYGMTDPKAAAAINAMAAKNNAANAAIGYKPTHTTQPQAAATGSAIRYVNNAAKYMPSVTPKAQMGAKTVTNQDPNNTSAKLGMLAFGANYMPAATPGAQATGSAANKFQSEFNKLGLGTGTGAVWDYYQSLQRGGGGAPSGGGSSPLSGLGSIAAGGGGLGGLGSMFGGGMGGLGGLGGMMGGGGMGGIGNALGGALGGGSGAPQAEEKEPDKPIPQRHWAGGYTSQQQAAMNGAKSNWEREKLKAGFDQENIAAFKGQESYDELKKSRVKQAQQLAERQGGAYDTEGNYYSKDAAKNATNEEKKKRAQAEANYYDVPDGAVPIAGNEGDKTPPGSTPAASGGKGSSSGSKSSSGGSSKLDNDWLKKLGGMAASWFGGG